MPVQKFKSFEEAERGLWVFEPDDRSIERLRRFYKFAASFLTVHRPGFILKFRSMQEANKHAQSLSMEGLKPSLKTNLK